MCACACVRGCVSVCVLHWSIDLPLYPGGGVGGHSLLTLSGTNKEDEWMKMKWYREIIVWWWWCWQWKAVESSTVVAQVTTSSQTTRVCQEEERLQLVEKLQLVVYERKLSISVNVSSLQCLGVKFNVFCCGNSHFQSNCLDLHLPVLECAAVPTRIKWN